MAALLAFGAATLTITAMSNVVAGGGSDMEPAMWVSAGDVAVLPTSGTPWQTMDNAAAVFDSSMTDYGWQDSTDGTHALAAALVSVRTGDEALRSEVADAIEHIATNPYVTDRNPTALGWARNMAAWIVASDLIDLTTYRPAVDEQWRAFLAGMPTHPYPGDNTLLDLAVGRANNIGVVARTAVTAIAIYTADDQLLAQMADLYRAWVEGSTVHRFDWYKSDDRSWQCDPDDPSTYRGINPPDCMRDGNDLGGVLPEEYRRNEAYDPNDYPGDNVTKYPWEALGGAIAQAELLRRHGYPDALDWGDQAPRRALERLAYLHDVAADRGWTFGQAAGGGSDDRWIIPLTNALYATDFPEPAATGHGRPMSWTDWTHQATPDTNEPVTTTG